MSVLTSAVRLSRAAGHDRAGRLGQQPGGFSAAFSARSFYFLFSFLRLRVHALVLPLASPLSFSSPFLLSFSFFVSFVVARVLVPLPLPLDDLLPVHLVARRSAGF